MGVCKREGLLFYISELVKLWDDLVEEAKRDLGRSDCDYIVFRYAILLFALAYIPPPTHESYKEFKKLLRCAFVSLKSAFEEDY